MVKMLVTKHTEFHKTLEEVEYKTFKTNINARDNKVGHGSSTTAPARPHTRHPYHHNIHSHARVSDVMAQPGSCRAGRRLR